MTLGVCYPPQAFVRMIQVLMVSLMDCLNLRPVPPLYRLEQVFAFIARQSAPAQTPAGAHRCKSLRYVYAGRDRCPGEPARLLMKKQAVVVGAVPHEPVFSLSSRRVLSD